MRVGEIVGAGARPAGDVACFGQGPDSHHYPAGFFFAPRAAFAMIGPMDEKVSVDEAGVAPSELVRLMRQIAHQNAGALEALYKRTSAKLYGIALRLLRDEAEAQDVLQDVYVRVWKKAESFDPAKAGAMTWLATLTRNRSIDRLRSRDPTADEVETAVEIADDSPSSLDVLEQEEDAMRLRRCLEELEERARTFIRSAFFDGATYPELADRAGVPLPTMKSWIRRGLQRLRGCLEQ